MANLEKDYNIYADLAQDAYIGRENNFPYNELKPSQQSKLDSNKSVKFNFSNAKDTHGNSIDSVYLQPDNIVKTVTKKKFFGKDKEYQKGLLTDEKACYNSYYLTDTPALNTDTKHTSFTFVGSDALPTNVKDLTKGWAGNNLNNWVDNNLVFAEKGYIPQAKLVIEAMHQKIAEMRTKAPNATMSMTGHSLGTMVTIQAVANLPAKDINKIDKVILFQGLDARESINKMSEQAQKNIQLLEE
ncbi:hypothetical protein BCR25_09625 [Enterococcus termitis]|uniref:Uncharacterized protein n=1 Tax=Enterococcus termitis TaxID=332950 RepID=A0A1E5GAN5_9ENTE|nr:hypothetical protein BCR25_09625 [Enterococcus termitis]OJG93833.1 hypothetical protein RV18_GL003624 [Enterococcus termitis]